MVTGNGCDLSFWKDKEVVLKAVAQNGRSLEKVSKELQNDKEIVMKAVAQNGRSLE